MTRPVAMVWAEGFLDRVAAEVIVASLGMRVEGAINDAGGVNRFWASVGKYNEAAKQCGIVFALADHDSTRCVGPTLRKKLPKRHANLVLRLSVAELEAWLLADAQQLGAYLSVSPQVIPEKPDKLPNPKQTLVNLARRSSKSAICAGMVPSHGHTGDRGAEYNLIMEEFIRTRWRPVIAARRSPSLARALKALREAGARQ